MALALLGFAAPAAARGWTPPPRIQRFHSANRLYRVDVVPGAPAKGEPYPEIREAYPKIRAATAPARGIAVGSPFGAAYGAWDPESVFESTEPPQPPGSNAFARFYRKVPAGGYALVSTFTLINPIAPARAFVSDDGRSLVTEDNWYFRDEGHVLSVYRLPRGALLASHGLGEIIDPAVLEILGHAAARGWSEGAESRFVQRGSRAARFEKLLFWGQRVSVDLKDGYASASWQDRALDPSRLTEDRALELLRTREEPPVRLGLLRFLAKRGTDKAMPALEKMIEDAWIRVAAVSSGAAPGAAPQAGSPAPPVPPRRGTDGQIRHEALEAYTRLAGLKGVPFLLRRFQDRADQGGRQMAAYALGQIYWRDWWEAKARTPVEPRVLEAFKSALAGEPDPRHRASLVGTYCHHFFPRVPDTPRLLRELSAKETDPAVRKQLDHWAGHMEKMYKTAPRSP